jgi:hypothetical protein
MDLNIEKEIEILKTMTVNQLKNKYIEVFKEETNTRNKNYLIKRIAWRIQADIEGGLSARALKRAKELANESDLRVRPTKTISYEVPTERTTFHPFSNDQRLPMPGSIITRQYKGRTIIVTVLDNCFEYEEKKYRSLSAVSKAVTGSHWNGFKFFNL